MYADSGESLPLKIRAASIGSSCVTETISIYNNPQDLHSVRGGYMHCQSGVCLEQGDRRRHAEFRSVDFALFPSDAKVPTVFNYIVPTKVC